MVSGSRCTNCKGPLTEGDPECPWCGSDPTKPVKGRELSHGSMLVMVAVLGMLVLALIYVVAMYEPVPESDYSYTHAAINLSSPTVTNRTIEEEVRWDAIFNVNKITPRDQTFQWDDVYIEVRGEDGSYMHRHLELSPDDPSMYDDGSDGRIALQVWSIENTDRPDRMEAGDKIRITGMTEEYEGCTITLHREGNRHASLTFPQEFP